MVYVGDKKELVKNDENVEIAELIMKGTVSITMEYRHSK